MRDSEPFEGHTIITKYTILLMRLFLTKTAWDLLDKAYKDEERVKRVRVQTLKGEFENIKMGETESISNYRGKIDYHSKSNPGEWKRDG